MVVALAQNKKRQLLIGTKTSHIFLMKVDDSIQKAKVVMSGHSDGNLWAMAIHRSEPFLYTGGEDQRLIKWNYVNTKKVIQ
jgi:microtubule-associated protein-like 5